MITVYAESPFVMQLALRQEHAVRCDALLGQAAKKTIDLALPIVALVEPLYTWRVRANDRLRLGNEWKRQIGQWQRTEAVTYKDAAVALNEAVLKAAAIDGEERLSIDAAITRVSAACRLLPLEPDLFSAAYRLEAKALTSIDAVVAATILHDARALAAADKRAVADDRAAGHDRALLAFDGKAINAAVEADFVTLGVKVFRRPDALAGWLDSLGVPGQVF